MLEITRADLHLLELIYDCVVVYDTRRDTLACRHCRSEDVLHIRGCYYGDLARLIDTLHRFAPDDDRRPDVETTHGA